MGINMKTKLRNFHQAKWDEPVIFELSAKGERGILVAETDDEIEELVGDGVSQIPENMIRQKAPNLPELSQVKVLRHYLRLSQENLGADLNIEIGQGTCTMKYSPKINEHLARNPKLSELHPLQSQDTVQGILEIIYKTDLFLREISGMDRFSFQSAGGSQAILAMVSVIQAYHKSMEQDKVRDEVITTIFSHPSDAAAAAVKGYKIITLYPDEEGYPDMEALRAAVSERTAALIVANPEDTGIFNPKIKAFTKIVHDAGGLCGYDQANANGLLGITRAKEAGFDLCFFNLHKTFSSPHGCGGPGNGALGVVKELEKFLPVPLVSHNGHKYYLDYDLPYSIGKIRGFYGVAPVILRAYSWIMSLGSSGLKEVARIAVLNNNYLLKKVKEIRGASAPYADGKPRIEQVRYSFENLARETGITSEDIQRRVADFGAHYWTSHHPFVVPEPATLEPTESYSKDDLDEYAAILEKISSEAYINADELKEAPFNSVVHKIDTSSLDDPERWAITWRLYLKKKRSLNK